VPDFFPQFYKRLLDSHPAIAPLFRDIDWERQHVLLRSGIVMMLLHAAGNPAASRALERIGRSHGPAGLGVAPQLYDYWIHSLLGTVRACDPRCSPEVEAAWREAACRGVAVMLGRVTSPGSSGRSQ
jgi:hemoglobin-like flavoprotein